MSKEKLGPSDKHILKVLQQEGRLSNQQLADRINLSTTPCWRRVRNLEKLGVIDRYVAILDPAKLGLHVMAYVQVSLLDHTEQTLDKLDDFVMNNDQVLECSSITGLGDYLLKVVATDAAGLDSFLMNKLLKLGIVRSTSTNFVLRQKKYTTALPLG